MATCGLGSLSGEKFLPQVHRALAGTRLGAAADLVLGVSLGRPAQVEFIMTRMAVSANLVSITGVTLARVLQQS